MANPLAGMMQAANNGGGKNPVFMLAQIMKSGGNPQKLIQQMISTNPQTKGILDMMQANNSQGLKEMAMNLSKQSGISIEDMANQLGLDMPNA